MAGRSLADDDWSLELAALVSHRRCEANRRAACTRFPDVLSLDGRVESAAAKLLLEGGIHGVEQNHSYFRPRGSTVSSMQVSPATTAEVVNGPWRSANDRTRYLGKRRRLMGPAEVTPVIVSRPTSRSENVASESDNFRRFP